MQDTPQQGQQAAPRSLQDIAVLRGDLSWVHIGGVLQVLEAQKLTGWLSVPNGEVVMVGGRFAGARYDGLSGVDAMVRVLTVERGSFAFHCGAPEYERTQELSSMLMRCGQALDDWWRLSGKVVEIPPSAATTELLRLLDGSRTLAEAVMDSGESFVTAVEVVADLADAGLAEVRDTEDGDSLADLVFASDC